MAEGDQYKPKVYVEYRPGEFVIIESDASHTTEVESDNGEASYDTTSKNSVQVEGFFFNEKSIRRAFVRKVYAILLSQLLVTLAIICWIMYHEPTKLLLEQYLAHILIAALATSFVYAIMIVCCSAARKTAPWNFILLGLFTVQLSLFLGMACSYMKTEVVMMAVGATAVICFALTMFAMQTKWDFTAWGGVLVSFLVILLWLGVAAAVFPSKIAQLAYSSLGAFLICLYFIYDTQMIMGGDHTFSISPEEYVFAALTLYLDVIYLFLRILRIVAVAYR